MTKPILPKLKSTHNVKNFNESGKWDVRKQDSLLKLSSGLKVDKVETDISSIPDMWARPMLFEMALLNPEHVLHKRILGEWRGLLAMLALKEVLQLNGLTASRITLPQLARSQNGENEDLPVVEQRNFLLTLTKLLPKASLATDTSWGVLFVFLYNGQPFGMTSPTTLVSTAADYLNRISSQDVRWFDGTHLQDPVEILSPRQRQILAGWISNLITSMGSHKDIDLDRWNLLAGLLRTFKNDLGSGESRLGHSSLGIQGTEAGLFRYLDKAAEGITDASHVQLLASPGRDPQRPLLVFDRSIAEQWNMSPQNVTVDGAQTLATAHPVVKNADLWRHENFFNKKVFVIFQENAFPGTVGAGNQSLTLPGSNSNVTPLLPLNSKLMEYLTATDLAQRVRWDRTPEGLVLRLFLQLSGPHGDEAKGSTVELTKLYRREDIKTLDNVPILEIWPNFTAPNWQAYYTCYSTDDVTGTFSATPFVATGATPSEVQLGGRRKRLYWQSSSYPEAILCTATIADEKSSQRETVEAGLLLLMPPQETQNQGNSYKVGIDFGAASTTICASTGQNSFPVSFENRKTSVTASGDRAQAQLFDFFVPRSKSEMPVLSFFQDFNNNPNGQALRPFLDGHAYLLETAEMFHPDTVGLAFDLKWSRDQSDRKRVTAFLTQLCLQTAAELVMRGGNRASWSFSYPTAFSDEQIQGFPTIWSQVTSECTNLSGLAQLGQNGRRSESDAAAVYFVTHCNAATAVGTVFIDIGGSTSDISIWQNNRPVWQTSVLLAGRSIFSNYLWHRPEFLGDFGIDVSSLIELKNTRPNDRRPFHAWTDVLLRYHSEKIFQNLPLHAGTDAVNHLRQHLALGVCSLFYYVGSVLRYMIDEQLYRPELPNLFLAGNGSRMFRWLDIDREGQINALYKAMFASGAQLKDHAFKVDLSQEPKMEAAYGLVSDRQLPTADNAHGVLAGESFIVEEELEAESNGADRKNLQTERASTSSWNTILTPEILTKKLRPPKKLERLVEFINTFNQFAKTRGLVPAADLSDGELEEVRRRLGQNLARYQGSVETSEIVVEPIFIVAVRQWLDLRLGN